MRPAATLCCGLPVESAYEENASPTRRARTEQRSPRTFESTSSRPPRALEGTRRRDGLAACPSRLRPGNAPLKRTRAEPSGSPALSPFAPFEKSPPERRQRETPDSFTSVEKFNSQLRKKILQTHIVYYSLPQREGETKGCTPPLQRTNKTPFRDTYSGKPARMEESLLGKKNLLSVLLEPCMSSFSRGPIPSENLSFRHSSVRKLLFLS